MSDPQASKPEAPMGEPVVEPTPTGDVVGRAQEGLADAEAARESVDAETVQAAASADAEPTVVVDAETPWYDRPDDFQSSSAETVVAGTVAADSIAAAPIVTPSEPAYVPPAAPQPIFVQAPEAPRPRGNRAAAGAIGILAAVVFAALYLIAMLGFALIAGTVTTETLAETATTALGTWTLWVPTAVFFIAFWLLGAIINRGRWGHWVVFGLLVGVASYGGHILGQLFQAPFWELTASEGGALVEGQLLAPLAIAAFVIGRELTIWFGAWVAVRGQRVTELNLEAQREYERTLEAGPQLVRQ